MTITIPRTYLKVFGVVFTSLLAPLGVRLLTDNEPDAPAVLAAPALEFSAPDDLAPATTRVVATGTGSSPDAAFQDALDAGLKRCIAAELGAADWAKFGPAYLTAIRHDGKGVVRGWRELSTGAERRFTGKVYRSEVSVEVDAEALRERLHPTAKKTCRGVETGR